MDILRAPYFNAGQRQGNFHRDEAEGGHRSSFFRCNDRHLDFGFHGNEAFAGTKLIPGKYVVIEVADNGPGMNEEVMAHLFEPFFTTKEAHRNGLGLATSYGIVRQSGGHICAESAPGQGSTFRIFLPPSSGSSASHLSETGPAQN